MAEVYKPLFSNKKKGSPRKAESEPGITIRSDSYRKYRKVLDNLRTCSDSDLNEIQLSRPAKRVRKFRNQGAGDYDLRLRTPFP